MEAREANFVVWPGSGPIIGPADKVGSDDTELGRVNVPVPRMDPAGDVRFSDGGGIGRNPTP